MRPVIRPLDRFSLSPGGRPLADQLRRPPRGSEACRRSDTCLPVGVCLADTSLSAIVAPHSDATSGVALGVPSPVAGSYPRLALKPWVVTPKSLLPCVTSWKSLA